MRWTKPEAGQERIRSEFLLLPKTISGETRWLERAGWLERYFVPSQSVLFIPPYWYPVRWLESSDLCDL
jgi:hypothetical protein